MEQLGLNEIRERFLKFFESKGHLRLPSFPLVPQGDKSLLLINSGMAPLKPFFTGVKKPPSKRVATSQKCIRTPDIERVGKTARHGTFFEMLGNFSFGDYFKEEAIAWAWEFVTEDLKLPEDQLWVSIYQEDDEAFEIWNKTIGVPAEKIVRLGKEDNFWEIGLGPCGPCSELYFDRGEKYGCDNVNCGVGCDCDRYVEFWNLVFTQFDRDAEGNYHRLEHPNIDTGMGLERMAAIMQGAETMFEVDTIFHSLEYILQISDKEYGRDPKVDVSIRVITDHIRGVTHLIGDGVLPSNEGRGYVLRRLIRRAARHGKLLGLDESFLYDVSDKVIDVSGDAYPELIEKRDYIRNIIKLEEEKFRETLSQGLNILQEYIAELKKAHSRVLVGDKAFKLYDTFGFPLDLTKDILEDEGMTVDEDGFEREMAAQRERAREARAQLHTVGWSEEDLFQLEDIKATKFEGYERCSLNTEISVILNKNLLVEQAVEGEQVAVILEATPFYAEGGGQVGDKGEILGEDFAMDVTDCKAVQGGRCLHIGKVRTGVMKAGAGVTAAIDEDLRKNIAKNHTATHLLHQALKSVLGEHVEQAGSLVEPERLRFDFTHIAALTDEQLKQVEDLVNSKILEGLKIETVITDMESARGMGALALFDEKYEDSVRVVKMCDFSLELCGGTHVDNTWALGQFVLASESGIAAGVRRIEALTGAGAFNYIRSREVDLKRAAKLLKTPPNNIVSKVEGLIKDLRLKDSEIESLNQRLTMQEAEKLLRDAKNVKGINVIVARVDNLDMNALRRLGDSLRDRLKSGVVVLASLKDGKVSMAAMATGDVVSAGIHCGNIIKKAAKAAGGGGGGKADMAQAGAKRPEDIEKALDLSLEIIESQLK